MKRACWLAVAIAVSMAGAACDQPVASAPAAKSSAGPPPPPPPPPPPGGTADGASSASAPGSTGASGPPAPPGLPAPSLRTVKHKRFIDLPGIDIPDEPPLMTEFAGGPILDGRTLKRVNSDPTVLTQLAGREQVYVTSDGMCEIWIPGAILLTEMMHEDWTLDHAPRDYFIRNADLQIRFGLHERKLRSASPPEEAVKEVVDGIERVIQEDASRMPALAYKVGYRKQVNAGQIAGEEIMTEDPRNRTATIERVYCHSGVLYSLTESGPMRSGPTTAGQKFFDSLRPLR